MLPCFTGPGAGNSITSFIVGAGTATYKRQLHGTGGFTATAQNMGVDDKDSDGNPATGLTGVYMLTASENNNSVDMGYYRPAALGGKVFADNRNGIQDIGDAPIPGVIVTPIRANVPVST